MTSDPPARMSLPRIYAVFNDIGPSPRRPDRTAVALDANGTFKALARAGITLHDWLALTIWDASDETEDLEADTTVYFDANDRIWYAEFDEVGLRYVPAGPRQFD